MKTTIQLSVALAAVLASSLVVPAQRSPKPVPSASASAVPTVTKIDLDGLKGVLKPNGRPLVVNFWATWCDPCREEFPELVKLDTTYKGKIDIITISLDEPEEIGTTVPKFLAQMRSTMPAYLLAASDEDAAIATIAGISSDFHGSLPFTLLIKPSGEVAYSRQGKINPAVLNTEIAKQTQK